MITYEHTCDNWYSLVSILESFFNTSSFIPLNSSVQLPVSLNRQSLELVVDRIYLDKVSSKVLVDTSLVCDTRVKDKTLTLTAGLVVDLNKITDSVKKEIILYSQECRHEKIQLQLTRDNNV